jgi:hypothetical protein
MQLSSACARLRRRYWAGHYPHNRHNATLTADFIRGYGRSGGSPSTVLSVGLLDAVSWLPLRLPWRANVPHKAGQRIQPVAPGRLGDTIGVVVGLQRFQMGCDARWPRLTVLAPFTEGATSETTAHDPLCRQQPHLRTPRQSPQRADPAQQ